MAEQKKTYRYEPKQVDISQFADLEDALRKVGPGDVYNDLFFEVFEAPMGLTLEGMFFGSVLSRAQALHSGIASEMRNQNPHAVIPLIRSLLETLVTFMWVVEHPSYIRTLMARPDNAKPNPNQPKRQSIQALIGAAKQVAPGLKAAYAELNEGTHFGPVAMWMPFSSEPAIETGTSGAFTFSLGAGWRSPEDPLFLAGQTLELTSLLQRYLRAFGLQRVKPKKPTPPAS